MFRKCQSHMAVYMYSQNIHTTALDIMQPQHRDPE